MKSGRKNVIGILAHVDAGKTTCIESMLFHCGVIRKMGRVDNRDAALDTDPQERAHGITIYSKGASITWKDTEIFLIDTPGHVDFSQEMERALSVIDMAVVLISGLDGVQAHTETIMNLLEQYKIPSVFFVNKMDIAQKGEEELLLQLENTFHNCIAWNREDTLENAAVANEAMMEEFLESGTVSEGRIAQAFSQRLFFPVFFFSIFPNLRKVVFQINYSVMFREYPPGAYVCMYMYLAGAYGRMKKTD